MTIFVTGAPGWLGTRLVEILRQRNKDVKCLVLPFMDDSYLRELGASIHKGDITDASSLKGACRNIKTVIHCAGIIHPKKLKDLYKINTDGTKNILTEAIASGVEKFIHVSSNSVGGINICHDQLMKESAPPRPYKHYGLSKYKAEQFVNKAFNDGKIKTTILRPCWFYGVRQPTRQTTFFKMIKKGNPLIFGKGHNLRSMTYIDNLIEAMILCDEKEISNGKTYWISDKKPYETIEIYQTIADLLEEKNFKPRFLPAFTSKMCEIADGLIQGLGLYQKEIHVVGEMAKDIACSIDKAHEELGYNPKIDLREGMRRSIEWCRNNGVNI